MKKMMFLLAALAAFAMPTAASALDVEGFYVGALGAANFLQHKHNSGNGNRHYRVGYAAGGMVGYRWCEGWRLEAEVSYRNNQQHRRNNRHFRSWSYMANGYYDFSDLGCYCWDITPYLGAGVGYTTERHRRNSHKHKHGFAWQIIAGLAYPICDCAEISLEYRFHKGRERKFYNHDVGATLKYFF